MKPKHEINVTREDLRSFARGEIDLTGLFHLEPGRKLSPNIHFETYRLTLDDIATALDNLSRRDPDDLHTWLACAITVDSPLFGPLMINESMKKSTYDKLGYPSLPVTDNDAFTWIIKDIDLLDFANEDELPEYWLDDHMSESQMEAEAEMADLMDLIQNVRDNRNKAEKDWEYPDAVKEDFIEQAGEWLDDGQTMPDHLMKLYRTYAEDMAEDGNEDALRQLAYGYDEGNAVFKKDSKKSKEYFEELLKNTGNPEYALELGDIAAQGLATDGKPDFNEAFQRYTYAAMNENLEGKLKLSDMFLNGEGIQKSRQTAYAIIQNMYKESAKSFLEDSSDPIFAEVTLRLGHQMEDFASFARETLPLNYALLYFYLQTARGIKEAYGDDTEESVKELYEKLKTHITDLMTDVPYDGNSHSKTYTSPYPTYLADMLNLFPLNLRLDFSDDTLRIIASSAFSAKDDRFFQMMTVLPELGYCSLSEELEILVEDFETQSHKNRDIQVDDISLFDDDSDGAVFFACGKEVLRIKSSSFSIAIDPECIFTVEPKTKSSKKTVKTKKVKH